MALLLCVLSLGCSGCGGADPSATASTASTVSPPALASDQVPPGGYSLHEWGVVTVGGTRAVVMGQRDTSWVEVHNAPAPEPLIEAEKPVLYVHTRSPLELEVRVTPRAPFRVVVL